MKVVIEIEIDDTRANAYNASLYDGPRHGDPVKGDGRDLVRDVVRESILDEIFIGGLEDTIISLSATLDGEDITENGQ